MKTIEKFIYSSFCILALFAATTSISAVSWSTLYQPVPPNSLYKYSKNKSK